MKKTFFLFLVAALTLGACNQPSGTNSKQTQSTPDKTIQSTPEETTQTIQTNDTMDTPSANAGGNSCRTKSKTKHQIWRHDAAAL